MLNRTLELALKGLGFFPAQGLSFVRNGENFTVPAPDSELKAWDQQRTQLPQMTTV